ncbi:hypothetical protein BH09ACT8_BH09ACT8_05340 [soil metagenome]
MGRNSMVDDTSLPERLREALHSRAICAYFQPIVSLADQHILGFEVLARWNDPVRGVISPAEFIPTADEHGMLDELLDQLMREAFTAASQWPHDVFLGFNVAPSQLLNPHLVTRVKAAANDCHFPLTRVHIEVTESALMRDMARAEKTLQDFIDQGCMIAMDDFGTGYSSLAWLSALPFSKIKIDIQFVSAMHHHRQSRKIVAAIIGLGQSLGLAVVAEGVETTAQVDLLARMGCQLAQGYLYSRPVPADQVAALITPGAEPAAGSAAHPTQMSLEVRALQLADLYNSEQTAIAFTDPSGTVIAASAAFTELMAGSKSPIVGQRIFDLITFTPEMLAELRAGDLLNRTFPTFECRTHRGGQALIAVRPLRDEDHELMGLTVMCIDITGPRGDEPASAVPSTSPPGSIGADDRYSWQLGDHGSVLSVGQGAEEVSADADPGDHVALGTGWVDFVHPDDLGEALRGHAEAIATGEPYDVDLRLHGGDGKYQWFRVHNVPQRGAQDAMVRWHGHCEPLSNTGVYASDGDQLAELLFSFESIPFTSWIAGIDGIVTRVSAGGATPARPGRSHLQSLLGALDTAAVGARLDDYLRRAEPFELSYEMCSDKKVTQMRCCAAPRRRTDGTVASWHGVILPGGTPSGELPVTGT